MAQRPLWTQVALWVILVVAIGFVLVDPVVRPHHAPTWPQAVPPATTVSADPVFAACDDACGRRRAAAARAWLRAAGLTSAYGIRDVTMDRGQLVVRTRMDPRVENAGRFLELCRRIGRDGPWAWLGPVDIVGTDGGAHALGWRPGPCATMGLQASGHITLS